MRGALRLLRWWPLGVVLAAASSGAQLAERCAQLPAQAQAKPAPAAVALLQARRDERSLALADYLLAAAGTAQASAARARLQDRARSSTDPMLTVMALHMPCLQPGCRNIEASQWSRLEPENLLAWLTLPAKGVADGRYLLDEIARHVRYSRNYQQEAAALLSELPPSGLELRQPWGVLNLRALAGSCRGVTDTTTAERCEAVAELLWADGGATERLVALVLARPARDLLPQRRAVWGPRLQELQPVLRAGVKARPTRARLCEAIALTRSGESAALSDAERVRMLEETADLRFWELDLRSRAAAMRTPP